MAEQVKALAVKPENLSPIPGKDMAEENRLLHVVLYLPPARTYVHTNDTLGSFPGTRPVGNGGVVL